MLRKDKVNGWWFAAGLVLLLPSSSIFPAEDLAADRRMYLPMFAFACLFARAPAIAPILVVVLAGWSFMRTTQVWNSEATLWREAVELSPGKVRPKIQLARVSRIGDAQRLLDEAARLEPANPEIPNELGVLWLRANRVPEALAAFGKALALAPGDPKTINNRGVALQQLGQTEAARQDFLRALAIDPCLADARRNLEVLGGGTQDAPACRQPR
jgi:protein O-mannosyl-transferase